MKNDEQRINPIVVTSSNVRWADGSQIWLVDDKWHREDGPAYVGADGTQAWYIDDKRVNEENFEEAVRLYHCKMVLES